MGKILFIKRKSRDINDFQSHNLEFLEFLYIMIIKIKDFSPLEHD